MSVTAITVNSFAFNRTTASALVVLALAGAGCAGAPPAGDRAETEQEIAAAEAALSRGGGPRGAGFTCTSGSCECDKSIENDCEDMSGVCSDDTVDDLITCIEGWLTTDCTCTLASVAPPKLRFDFAVSNTSTKATLSAR